MVIVSRVGVMRRLMRKNVYLGRGVIDTHAKADWQRQNGENLLWMKIPAQEK
jgi:hypothetical protein